MCFCISKQLVLILLWFQMKKFCDFEMMFIVFWEYLKYENSNLRSLMCSSSLHITFWKSFVERNVFLHFKITCIDLLWFQMKKFCDFEMMFIVLWEYLKYENSNLRSLICSSSLHITFWKSFVERSMFLHFQITCIDSFWI